MDILPEMSSFSEICELLPMAILEIPAKLTSEKTLAPNPILPEPLLLTSHVLPLEIYMLLLVSESKRTLPEISNFSVGCKTPIPILPS